jgi:hypothetical protein
VNIWAETEAGIAKTIAAASASAESRAPPRQDPVFALPPEVMTPAFH